jgi:hypothetical protein
MLRRLERGVFVGLVTRDDAERALEASATSA